jgi:hypothetical protein
MNDELGVLQMSVRRRAEPANDGHAAIVTVRIDQYLASQVVIEMDLVPRLL